MSNTKTIKNSSYNSNNSKTSFQVVEQERNLLKITLDYVVKENASLKQQLEDMKTTVKHNKELLKEYVDRITNKDKVVEKMNATIDQLTSRMQTLEEFIKKNKLKKQAQDNITSAKSNQSQLKGIRENNKNTQSYQNSNSNYNSVNNTNMESTTISGNTGINTTFNKRADTKLISSVGLSTANSVRNDEKSKEFFDRQKIIIEEMSSLKDDLQFLLENNKKSKLQEKLEQSARSLNNSIIGENKGGLNYSMNGEPKGGLNNSFISNISTRQTKNNKYNLKEKFNIEPIKFQEFLNNYNATKNILLLVDSKNNLWELVQRIDLTISSILNNKNKNIMSITSNLKTGQNLNSNKYLCISPDSSHTSKLLNIEIKDNYDSKSIENSEIDISRITDLNISYYVKDINE